MITNGLSIALTLEAAHPRLSIVVTGGTLRPKQHSLVDPLAGSMLKGLSVDTVFLGCNGIDPDGGVTNINLPEADIKRAMIAASQRCVVLADSTKLGTRALAMVCEIDDVDVRRSPTAAASPDDVDGPASSRGRRHRDVLRSWRRLPVADEADRHSPIGSQTLWESRSEREEQREEGTHSRHRGDRVVARCRRMR